MEMSVKIANKNKSDVALSEYAKINGRKYFVDNKKIVFEITNKEVAMAVWLSSL